MRKWIAVLAALALATGLGVAAVAQDEASDDEAAVREIAGRWAEAWNAGDMDAIGAIYAADADYVDIFGQTYSGRAAIQESFTEINGSAYKGSKISIETVNVTFVKPDLVVTDSEWKVTGLPEGDGPAPPSEGQTTAVSVKVDGEWKITAHRSRIPQAPTPPGAE